MHSHNCYMWQSERQTARIHAFSLKILQKRAEGVKREMFNYLK